MPTLIDLLRAELGDDAVLTGDAVTARAAGWGQPQPNAARAIVRPRSTAEVSRVLRLCFEHDQPVCVQGGMTGLVRGGTALQGELVLSLERLTRIETIDPTGRTMTVEAGVTLQAIQERAQRDGLLFPLDLGARGSCQIGGNVATNAGGNRVIRYGMTRALVLGVEAVLADGTVISSLSRVLKNNSGYDLKHLFVGSEGTLGVVTRVVLRLERQPRSHHIALVALRDFAAVTGLLRLLEERLSGTLSAFEVMWPSFYQLVTSPPARNAPPLPPGAGFYVLAESLGGNEERDGAAFEEALGAALEGDLAQDAVIGHSSAERDRLWAIRDDVEQLGRLGPIFTFDISLAIPDMPPYLEAVEAALKERFDSPRWVVFGHLGDGNLHLVISVGDGGAAARHAVEAIVYGALVPYHGVVSAEHGIGVEKRDYLALCRDPAEIELMRRIKHALDPKDLLNRGRVLKPR